MNTFQSVLNLMKQLGEFMKAERKWWLGPLIILLILLGLVLVAAQGSPFAPFIYTIF